MTGTLPLYWKLASDKPSERLVASCQLVDQLLHLVGENASKAHSVSNSAPEPHDNGKPKATSLSTALPPQARLFKDSLTDCSTAKSLNNEILRADVAQVARIELVLETEIPTEISYAIKRLLRGLASPRQSSRLGFATALTELLCKLPSGLLGPDDVLTLLLHYTKIEGKASGQEERDGLFAKVFAVHSLVLSGLLFTQANGFSAAHSAPSSSESTDLRAFQRAIHVLQAVAAKKVWLRESCAWVIIQSLKSLRSCSLAKVQKREAVRWLWEQLFILAPMTGKKAVLTADKLAVLLYMQQENFSDHSSKQAVVAPLKFDQALHPDNVDIIARILKGGAVTEVGDADKGADLETGDADAAQGTWRPEIPFAWHVIFDIYFGEDAASPTSAAAVKRVPFATLFRVAVEEKLFAPSASSERKLWGFKVFQMALVRIAASAEITDLQLLFQSNIMRSCINHLSKADRFLHAAAVRTMEVLHEVATANPSTALLFIKQLLGRYGSLHFDRLTGTKTVEGLLAKMDTKSTKDYLDFVIQMACQSPQGQDSLSPAESDDGPHQHVSATIDLRRKWAVEQMHILVRQTAIQKDEACIESILNFLCTHGFGRQKKSTTQLPLVPMPPFSADFQEHCRSRFVACLGELNDQTTTVVQDVLANGLTRTYKAQGVKSGRERWISSAVDMFYRLKRDKKNVDWLLDAQLDEQLQSVHTAIEALRKTASSRKDSDGAQETRMRVLEALLCAGFFYSASMNKYEDSTADLLTSLVNCKDAALVPEFQGDEETPSSALVLTDAIVSCLEQPSAFLRSAALQAFGVLTDLIDVAAIDHIIEQFNLGAEGEVEEEASDEENAPMFPADAIEVAEMTSDTSFEESEEDEADEDVAEVVNEEFRAKVQAALREANIADTEDVDGENDSDGDHSSDSGSEVSDLGDEQMLALDEKLAQIFKLQASNKKAEQNAKVQAMAFQNRLLDLLDIFARKQACNILLLRLFKPLLQLVKDSQKDEQQLRNKAAGLLQNRICKAKEVVSLSREETPEALELLKYIHAEARSSTASGADAHLTPLHSAANLYLTKALLGSSDDHANIAPDITDVYADTLAEFVERKRSAVKPVFVSDAFKCCPSVSWTLRDRILAACRPGLGAGTFKQVQAFQLLQTMVTQQAQLAQQAYKNNKELLEFLPEVARTVIVTLRAACTSSDEGDSAGAGESAAGGMTMNAARLKEVLKFGMQAARITQRAVTSAGDLAEKDNEKIRSTSKDEGEVHVSGGHAHMLARVWNTEKLREVDTLLATSSRFAPSPSVRSLWKQLLGILSIRFVAPVAAPTGSTVLSGSNTAGAASTKNGKGANGKELQSSEFAGQKRKHGEGLDDSRPPPKNQKKKSAEPRAGLPDETVQGKKQKKSKALVPA
ncbi:hypothetical protein K437DRAFT_246994 [Tilletiaria anomala UBC 951]|uniref:DNA polymerase V n=1 Tax=Tilletiaria anomala (strain ATCC 24038 / CBS 436.72 / UBC 951) TaxID=1037660 RepID=A0A066VWB4_TILAU|nr:uncharacterized protein K437DRAFT_246994 [Tilletiaria anomala UBC 951]KDN45766.1 hypothetical protein K437DRAFT_246994 [Tilletiaria anomala UBC 951]